MAASFKYTTLPGNSHGRPELYWKIMVCCHPLTNLLRTGWLVFANRLPLPNGNSQTVPIFTTCGRSKAYTLRCGICRCVSVNAAVPAPMNEFERAPCSIILEYV